MAEKLTEIPNTSPQTFLDLPYAENLDDLDADIAVLGIPFGMPYHSAAMANDQSRAPDAIRSAPSMEDIEYTKNHFDFDLDGYLFAGKNIKAVDCGNVTADPANHAEHYRRAEEAARKIFASGAILVVLGGDHGVPIPVMKALEVFDEPVTLVHVDAHLDWRDEVNGETEGYSSPIRRASEMPWIDTIVQIGLRGIGSARAEEVADARAHGADLISAYEMHDIGMDAVLDRIPDGGPFYLTIDADGIDPTIMPAVMAQTPGGLDWTQIRNLVHGLVNKGRVVGMDLVEIAPMNDVGNVTMIHAERLICNFIGASVRAGHCRQILAEDKRELD
ncbi:MAG: agmatinase [Gammaproteobacteria bacterium]|nr:agmatinase [Gammaproteobacteria bacterium]